MYDIILHKFTLRHYIIIEKDFLAFAKKIGVELSEEDIENDCKEMTDEDLAKVAGGMSLEDFKPSLMIIIVSLNVLYKNLFPSLSSSISYVRPCQPHHHLLKSIACMCS